MLKLLIKMALVTIKERYNAIILRSLVIMLMSTGLGKENKQRKIKRKFGLD